MPSAPSALPLKPGPPLPDGWQARFLARYRVKGGLWRSAEAAGVSPHTLRRYRAADPAFDAEVRDAKEYYADLVEEQMMALGERSDNPVPSIVRLKALRPAEYIEKHAVLSLNVTASLASHDATALLSDLLAHTTDSTRRLLASAPQALDAPHPPDDSGDDSDSDDSDSATIAAPQTQADDDW